MMNTIVNIRDAVNLYRMRVGKLTYGNGYYSLDESYDLIDHPNKLFGIKATIPYVIIFTDTVGNSVYGGGNTCIFGYTYADDMYGAQIKLMYNAGYNGMIRNNVAGTWSDWAKI